MICHLCKQEKTDLTPFRNGDSTIQICRDCLELEEKGSSCRCKDVIGKSNTEILKMALRDMLPKKK